MQTSVSDPDPGVSGASSGTTPAPSPRPPARPPGGGLGQRALWMIVVAALLAGGYAWYEQQRVTQALRGDVALRLTAADSAAARARERESDLGNELRDAQAKLALLEARVTEFQSQQASLEALYRELAPSRDELALSEV